WASAPAGSPAARRGPTTRRRQRRARRRGDRRRAVGRRAGRGRARWGRSRRGSSPGCRRSAPGLRRADPRRRAAPGDGRGRRRASVAVVVLLVELLAHLLEKRVEAVPVDDLVELGAVVLEHALLVGDHVVDHPVAFLPEHLVLEGDLGLLAAGHGVERRRHVGLGAVLLFLVVLDVVVRAAVHLFEVAALDQLPQRLDELVALLGGELVPVLGQRAAGQLLVIEERADQLLDFAPFQLGLGRPVGLVLLQNLVELGVGLLQLRHGARVGGRRRLRGPGD